MNIFLFLINIKNYIFDILLPIKCFNCGLKNEVFCKNCIQNIGLAKETINEKLFAVFDYQDPIIKKAIWELKYHHKLYLGKKLGQLLYQFNLEDISDIRSMCPGQEIFVIPVPISKKRLSKRGYNQSKIIAHSFCSSSQDNIFELRTDLVYKKIDTLPQAKILNRKKRLKNIQGVFSIKNSNIIKGRTIIIIDDVITTGATMSEMMKIIKKAGAKKVFGMAIAH